MCASGVLSQWFFSVTWILLIFNIQQRDRKLILMSGLTDIFDYCQLWRYIDSFSCIISLQDLASSIESSIMSVTFDHIASPQQSTPGVSRERCLLATLGDGLRATSEGTSVSWKLWRSSTLRRGDWSFLRIWLCLGNHSYAQYIYRILLRW